MKIIIKCDDPLHFEVCIEVARTCVKDRQSDWSDIVGFRRNDHLYWAHFLKSGTITVTHQP